MAKNRRPVRGRAAGRQAGPGQAATPDHRRRDLYLKIAVAAAAVLVYLNAPGNEFVLDDIRLVRDNVRIRSLANVPGYFLSGYWDLEGPQALYRPLALASYALNYAAHGSWPNGYTLVNIALHASVAVLLVALLRAIGGSLFVAGLAGLAFAVHPVHTEAVTPVFGRPELLAAFFFLAALHFHRRVLPGGRPAAVYRAASLACFACALLSKESAMTMLLVLPVMDALAPSPRAGAPATLRSRVVADYLPLAIVAAAYLVLRRAAIGAVAISEASIAPLDNPLVPVTTMPLGEQLGASPAQAVMTTFAVMLEYARLLVWPAALSPDYSYNQIPLVTSALDPRFLAGAALAAFCLCGIALLWRRSPLAAFGLAFLTLTFSIVSNLAITIGTMCAERLVYLPSAGVLIAGAVGAERLANSRPLGRHAAYAAVALLIVLGAARTWTRNADWKNEQALWSAAVQVAPDSARVQSEYGRILLNSAEQADRAGRTSDADALYSRAQAHFEKALEIFPSYSPPIDSLAMIHSLNERFDEALPLYERSLQAWPGNYGSLANWGSALWQRSRRVGMRAAALREQGSLAESDALVREADAGFREGLEKVERAISMMPTYAHAHLLRATMLESYVGDREGAIAEYEEVLRLTPDHPQRAAIEAGIARLRSQAPGAARSR